MSSKIQLNQLNIRGIRTNSEFIFWTKIDFCEMHFAKCIKFYQKLQIRGSYDLIIFVIYYQILAILFS